MPPTVLHKNRKIMRDKNNCRVSKKKCYSSNLWWVVRLTVGYFLFLDHLDATYNHATILQDCFSRYLDEMNTTHEGDIVLVDRGFRDVVNFLTTNKKLHVYYPGLGQLNTIEANTSRFVTKCRWVIEQVFGLKRN